MFDFIKNTYKVGDAVTLRCKDGTFSGQISFISENAVAITDKNGQKHLIKGEDIYFCEDFKETEAPKEIDFTDFKEDGEKENSHVKAEDEQPQNEDFGNSKVQTNGNEISIRKYVIRLVCIIAVAMGLLALGRKCISKQDSSLPTNHEYVDLGLPSGTLWATCNVGASKPEEYGDYFAWGETSPKEDYYWTTYKWCNGSENTLTKYCVNGKYGTVDNLTTLLAEDDAATANWGNGWRMPTFAEQKELIEGCKWEWTTDFNGSGVSGYIVTSKTNGNTIFLPAAGFRDGSDLYGAGDRYGTDLVYAGYFGNYWSSSLFESDSYCAYSLDFASDIISWNFYGRYSGRSVRAVVK